MTNKIINYINRNNGYKKNQYKKNIGLIYAYTFFDGLILAYVIERLFGAERGMTVTMVVMTEIIYGITVSIFEIPSGVLADLWGRKKMLIIAAFLSVIEFVIIFFAHGFVPFALATIAAGLSKSAESGSVQAIIYDSLLADKNEEQFEKVYGRFRVCDTVGSMIAALTGGLFAHYLGFEFVYAISIGSKAIAFLIIFFMVEPIRIKEEATHSTLIQGVKQIKEGFQVFKKHPNLFSYCACGMLLGACINYMDEFWQLLMEEVHIPIILFGLISVSFSIFTIPGNLLVDKLKKRISYRTFFLVIPFVYGAGFFGIALLKNYLMLLPIVVLGLWRGLLEPLLEGYINHKTESSVRATVESMVSMIMRVVSIVVGIIFSLFADRDIFLGFLSLGVICIVYGMIHLYFHQKNEKITESKNENMA